ncbi:HNH endonuclease signature motif containing protein [Sporomusa sphaeroides]|uniref:HNH endonuclease signature motif containing protein n=1 Tax=Sporomusa sphaeroides TaxID=47679 RepID=UPI003D7C33C9
MRGNPKYNCPEERILANIKINSNTGCWEWTGALKGKDRLKQYGHLTIGSRSKGTRKTVSAHRYSYKIYKGNIPDNMDVCHKCDNPKCVNPEHLFIGTRQDNVNDRESKGRNKTPHLTGDNHPSRKLTYEIVKVIRSSKESSTEISKRYGVCSSLIRAIRRGEYWKPPLPGTEGETRNLPECAKCKIRDCQKCIID